jgi:signal transduction histidine kinase
VYSVSGQLKDLLSPQLESAGIRMVIHIDEQVSVRCPEDGLQRLLLNLVTNAIQAMPDGGEITLTARVTNELVEIVVEDNGPGIEAEIRSQLFEPFRTSKARGAGLGLAVCKKIVDRCGGGISVDDAPGGGARFMVSLPVVLHEGSL